jgi:glycolate oxidase FAD binding subunit
MGADVVRPTTVDAVAAAMRAASDTGATVRVRGGGSKWSWGAAAPDPDVVIDVSALDGVIEHAAGDLVVTVGPGTQLAGLQQRLATAGQWLALDPPEDGATVGGVVATASSGPRRLRYGTPRDLLIGLTVVLADGTVARSGGKVVKNVAGYDLGKLFTGSFGTLGVIAECTLRLHPIPKARRVVTMPTEDPAPLVTAILRSPAVPSAIEWDGEAVHVLVESVEAAATAQAEQLVRLAGGGDIADTLPMSFGARPWVDGDVAVKVTHRLSALGPVLDAVRRHLPASRLAAHAGSGVIHAGWSAAAEDAGERVTALRAEVAAHDGSVVLVDAPEAVKAALDVWGPASGLAVMRRIKAQFDPDARMAPGRFVGGI